MIDVAVMSIYFFHFITGAGVGVGKIGVNPSERKGAVDKAMAKVYLKKNILLHHNDVETKLFTFYQKHIWKTISKNI